VKNRLPVLLIVCAALNAGVPTTRAQAPVPGVESGLVRTVPFEHLSDKNITLDGRRALAIRSAEWKHAETPHFVFHFFRTSVAAPVWAEAEFYHRYITADLEGNRGEAGGGPKTHIYLFESRADWVEFRKAAQLEPWTGAVHIDGALFVPRYPEYKWKGSALGHEIAHLLVYRFVGTRTPLWLKEGYAEDVSSRGYAAFYRARGYLSTPRELIPAGWIPLAQLTAFAKYPEEKEVATFYREARALVAFLSADGSKAAFLKLHKDMGQGTPFATALRAAYGSRWSSLEVLEAEFKKHMELMSGL